MMINNPVMLKEGAFRELSEGEGVLIGSKCPKCELICFPKMAVCPSCFEVLPEDNVEIGKQGQIDAFAVSYVAPEGFQAPYVQAYVKLKEGPRIFSLLDLDITSIPHLYKGMEVRLRIKVIGKDVDGRNIIGWAYQPIMGDEGNG